MKENCFVVGGGTTEPPDAARGAGPVQQHIAGRLRTLAGGAAAAAAVTCWLLLPAVLPPKFHQRVPTK